MVEQVRRFSIVALLVVALATIMPAKAAPDRVALVIGNGAYQHAPELANPANDANAIATSLEGLGFTVFRDIDLSRANMERLIRDFAKTLNGSNAGLFFYAGHGLQVNGKNYLVPVDAELNDEIDLEFEAIDLDSVLRIMERSTKTNMVFLDACRNNPLARNLARSMGTRSAAIGRGLAPVEAGVGTMVAYSTQPGNVAVDGDGKNSPFAAALLEQIGKPGIDVAAMLRRVRLSVIEATNGNQVPWSHSSLTGDFYFVNQGNVTVEVPPTPRPFDDRELELAFWNSVKDSVDASQLEAYLNRYPRGTFVQLAQLRIASLALPKTVDYAFSVQAEPEDAETRILNITTQYRPSMRLEPGRYQIEVNRSGYQTHRQWVEITDADRVLVVSLAPVSDNELRGSVILEDGYDRRRALARTLFGADTMRFEHSAGRGCLTALHANAVLPAMYPEPVVANFVAELDMNWGDATPASQYGLIFRSDDEAAGLAHYYLLNLVPKSDRVEFTAWDGAWVVYEAEPLPAGTLSRTDSSRLRVEARSNSFRLYLNDGFVAEFTDSTLPAPGLFGLSIVSGSSPETVCFDNLTVRSTL
jgi:hypothetical protein